MPETAVSPQNGAEGVSAVRGTDVMVNSDNGQRQESSVERYSCPISFF